MRLFYTLSLLGIVLLFLSSGLSAQIIISQTPPAPPIISCGPAKPFKITITNNSVYQIDSVEVTIALQSGILYSSLVPKTNVSVRNSNSQRPVFALKNLSLAPSGIFTFQYNATANCSTINPNGSNSSSTGQDSVNTIYYSVITGINQRFTFNTAPSSYQIFSPDLTYNSNNFIKYSDTLSLGKSLVRKLVIVNTSNTSFTGEFVFTDNFGTSLSIDSINAKAGNGSLAQISKSISGNTSSYKGSVVNLGKGDSIIVSEKVRVIACLSGSGNTNGGISNITFNWGCPGNICRSVSTQLITPIINRPRPGLLSYTAFNETSRNICKGTQSYSYKIINTGGEICQDIKLQLIKRGTDTFIDSTTVSVILKNKDNKTTAIKNSFPPAAGNGYAPIYSNCISKTFENGYIHVDTLRPLLDTLVVSWTEVRCCTRNPDKINIMDLGISTEGWQFLGTFQYECLSSTPQNFNTGHYVAGNFNFKQQYEPIITHMPGDPLKARDTATFSIENKGAFENLTNYKLIDRKRFQLKVVIKVDKGLALMPDSNIYFGSKVAGVHNWLPQRIEKQYRTYNAFKGKYQDTVFVAFFNYLGLDTNNHSGGLPYYLAGTDFARFLSNSEVLFTLRSECPARPVYSRFSQEIYLVPDSTCSNAYSCEYPIAATDTSISTINVHCPGCLISATLTKAPIFKRISFGFEDFDNDLFPDKLPPIKVNKLTPGIKNNRGEQGDTILTQSSVNFIDGANKSGPSGNGISYDSLRQALRPDAIHLFEFKNFYFNQEISFGKVFSNVDSIKFRIVRGVTTTKVTLPKSIVKKYTNGFVADFFYHLSLDTLYKYGLDTSYHYQVGDHFFVDAKYVITENIRDYATSPSSTDFLSQSVTISDQFFFTGTYYSSIPSARDAVTVSINTPGTPAGTYKKEQIYYCEYSGTGFTLIGNIKDVGLAITDGASECEKRIRIPPPFQHR